MALDQTLFTILVSIVILILVYGFYLMPKDLGGWLRGSNPYITKEQIKAFINKGGTAQHSLNGKVLSEEEVREYFDFMYKPNCGKEYGKEIDLGITEDEIVCDELVEIGNRVLNSVADNETHYQDINSGYKRKPVEFRKINEGIPMDEAVKIGLVGLALHDDDTECGSGLEPLLDKCKKILSKHGVIKIVDSEVER